MATTKYTSSQLKAMLAKKYCQPEYAFFTEVKNQTGFSNNLKERYIDGLAMSLYPSRTDGHKLLGFEIKVHRNDWVSELNNPDKAEALAQYCHYWYLVVSNENIVKDEELPIGWGLMIPDETGNLKTIKKAPLLEAVPITIPFLAAILRRADSRYDSQNYIHKESINDELTNRYELGYKKGSERYSVELENAKDTINKLRTKIADFEKESGVSITYDNKDKLVKLLKILSVNNMHNLVPGLKTSLSSLIDITNSIGNVLVEINKLENQNG